MLKHVGAHRHVIRLVACCTQRPLLALLEHAPRGDLLTLLRAARGRRREPVQDSGVADGRPSEADSKGLDIAIVLSDCLIRKVRLGGYLVTCCTQRRKKIL